jgi:hypothetical protein
MSSGVCGGHSRHWFTRHGSPGERTDRCVRCGSPRKQEPVSPAIPVNLAAAADLPGYRVGSDGSMWKDQGNGKFRKLKIFVERGIARVCVVKPNGKTAKVSVANLVLRSFGVPQPPGHRALRFPDDDPLNNSISNLRWAPISISLAGTKSRRPTGSESPQSRGLSRGSPGGRRPGRLILLILSEFPSICKRGILIDQNLRKMMSGGSGIFTQPGNSVSGKLPNCTVLRSARYTMY